jgi:hypothetical protein
LRYLVCLRAAASAAAAPRFAAVAVRYESQRTHHGHVHPQLVVVRCRPAALRNQGWLKLARAS